MDSSDCVFSQTEPIKSYVIGQLEESGAECGPITSGKYIAPPTAPRFNNISLNSRSFCYCNTLFTSTVLSDSLLLHLKYHSHLILFCLFCKILQLIENK